MYEGISPHKSVMVQEILSFFSDCSGCVYLDATFGSGGHSRAILEQVPESKVIAIDWDIQAVNTYGKVLEEEFGDRFHIVWSNFSDVHRIFKRLKQKQVAG